MLSFAYEKLGKEFNYFIFNTNMSARSRDAIQQNSSKFEHLSEYDMVQEVSFHRDKISKY